MKEQTQGLGVGRSDWLFGLGRLLDLGGTQAGRVGEEILGTPDGVSLALDWVAVGNDLNPVLGDELARLVAATPGPA